MSLKTLGLSIVIGSLFTGAKAFASSQYAVTKLDGSLKKLNDHKSTLRVDSKEFAVALKRTQLLSTAITKLKKNSAKLESLSIGRDKFKSQIMDTAAMGAVAITPIKMAVDFETSFVGIQKVIDFNSDGEMKKMQKDILNMSTTLPVSAAGLSEIAASMGGIGLAKKDILGATKAVAIMSTAFDMSADAAGDSMGKLMNVYGLSVKEVMAVGDTINAVDAGTAAKARLTVEVLGRIGGASKAMGLSAHSAAGLAGAFLDLGVAPEVAGTGINALLSKMMTADKQGAKFQRGLKAIGMDAKGMKNAIAKDANGTVNTLMNTLAKLPKASKMGVLVDMFGTEYADDIALVVGGIDRYNKATSIAADTTKNAGSMQEEFAKQSKTTANQMKLLAGSVTAIGVNVGTALLPAVNSIVGVIKKGSDIVGNFSSKHETATKIIGGLTVGVIGGTVALAVFGYAASFVQGGMIRLSSAYTLATLGIKSLSARMGLATGIQWLWNAALNANPIGLIVLGISALAGAAFLIYKNWEPIKTFFVDIFSGVAPYISGVWDKIKAPIARVWTIIKNLFSWTPIGMIISNWGAISSTISNFMAPVTNIVSNAWNGVKSVTSGVFDSIKSTLSIAWDSIKTLLAWTPLGMIISNWGAISSVFITIVDTIKKPFIEFFDWIGSKFTYVIDKISSVASFFANNNSSMLTQTPIPKPINNLIAVKPVVPASKPTSNQPNQNQETQNKPNSKPNIPSIPPRSQSMNNNVTVNISNPNFANKEHAAATQKQIDEQVRKALARQKNDKADRSYS